MRTQDELRLILSENPECFDALCEMSDVLHGDGNYAGCFAMLERAIAVYESAPDSVEQVRYFELKRIRTHLVRNHLQDILGDVFPMLDLRWMPVFKLGRIRETAWRINDSNIQYLEGALQSPMMRRVRYFSLVFESCANDALIHLCSHFPGSLRALGLAFREMPGSLEFMRFWQSFAGTDALKGVVSFTVALPVIDDEYAMLMRQSFQSLERFELISTQRRSLTSAFCEELADDERSNALTRLALVGTNIGDDGFFTLVSSENFSALQVLDVHDGVLTNAAARILSAEHNLSNLRSIDLSYNRIDPAGIDMIQRARIDASLEGQHSRPGK